LDTIIKRVNEQEITNSKELRKLRQILKDPVGKEKFLSAEGSIESALKTLSPPPSKKAHGLLGDIDQLSESLQRYPWTTLAAMKGDPQVIRKLEETEKLIKELKKALSR
jgi:ParB family chromosome partitioning protein